MIRYDKKFNAEIASAVKRYNAKIKYYEKLGVYTLPEKTKVSEIKKDVKSRQEIRKKLRNLEKLNAKNLREVISGGEIKTLYEHKLEVQRLANVKRKVSRKLRALSSQKPTLFGKEMPFTFTQYGTDEYVRTKQMKEFLNKQNLQTMNYKQYQNLLKVIERIEVNYINPAFKNNIIDMLDSIAYYYNYSNEERNKLKQKINSLSNDEFTKMFKKDFSFQSIIDYYLMLKLKGGYNPDSEDMAKLKDILDSILENFDDIYKNTQDSSLVVNTANA